MGQASSSPVYEARDALTSSFCDDLVAKLDSNPGCISISVDPSFAEEDKVVLAALGVHLKRYMDLMTASGYKMPPDLGDNGYFVSSADRDSGNLWDQNRSHHRIMTFVFYLNDVKDAETVFNFCNVKVKPAKGKLLVFPSSWRNLHSTRVRSGSSRFLLGDVHIKTSSSSGDAQP